MRSGWILSFSSTVALLGLEQPAVAKNQPPEFAVLKDTYDRVFSPGWTPDARLSADSKLPKACSAGKAMVQIDYPATSRQSGKAAYVRTNGKKNVSMFRGPDGRYGIAESNGAPGYSVTPASTPVRYQGEAVGCRPKGRGVITFADGSMWVGDVDFARSYGDSLMDFEYSLPMKVGTGMHMAAPGQFYPLHIVEGHATVSEVPGSQGNAYVPAVEFRYSIAMQQAPDQPWRSKTLISGTSYQKVEVHFADGGVIRADFKDNRIVSGTNQQNMPEYTSSKGAVIKASIVEITASEPIFSEVGGVVLLRRTGDLPAGKYAYVPTTEEAAQKRVVASNMFQPDRSAHFRPRVFDTPAMLKDIAFANPKRCDRVPGVPADWKHWWPSCMTQSEPGGPRSEAYSPDGTQYVMFTGKSVKFYAKDGRFVAARSFGGASRMTPVDLDYAVIPTELGSIYYTGPFSGMRPDGEGRCTPKRRSEPEPCVFVAGVRTDDNYLARLDDHNRAVEIAKRKEREQQQQARYEAEQARIRAQRQLAEQERERLRQERRAEIEAENARRNRAAAIAGAFNDVARSMQQSNRAMAASRAEVYRQNSGAGTPRISTLNSAEAEAIYRRSPAAIAKPSPIRQPSPAGTSGNSGTDNRASTVEARSTAEFRAIREKQARDLAELEDRQAQANAERAQAEAQSVAQRERIAAARERDTQAQAVREAEAAAPSGSRGDGKPLNLYLVVKKADAPIPQPTPAPPPSISARKPASKAAPTPSAPINPNATARQM